MNVGHEEEELKPYAEPEPDFNDTKRIGKYLSIVRGTAPGIEVLYSAKVEFQSIRRKQLKNTCILIFSFPEYTLNITNFKFLCLFSCIIYSYLIQLLTTVA